MPPVKRQPTKATPHRNRDARDGEFVSDADAAADPGHTVRESVERKPKPEAVAKNLATFLSEQIGVTFAAADNGTHLVLSIEDAQAIYHSGAALFTREAPGVAGQLWRGPS